MDGFGLRHELVRNNLRFLKLWLQRPTRLGALVPSGTVTIWVNAIFEGLIGAVGSAVFLAVYAAMHRQLAGESPQSLSQTFE